MVRIKMSFVCLFVVATFFAVVSTIAQSTNAPDTLNQYVADLQKNPSDTALREKIIKLAREMNPPPAIQEEARRHYVIAKTLTKDTKKAEDFAEPIAEFKSVLLIAPWWGAANGEFGMLLEAAGRYDEAMSALKLYIATNPGEEKARGAQDEIYIIEAKQKKAAKEAEAKARESSPEAVAAQQQNKFEEWLKKLDGRRYTYPNSENGTLVIDVRGNVLVWGVITPRTGYSEQTGPEGRPEIRGRETTVSVENFAKSNMGHQIVSETVIITEDGDRLTVRRRFTDGDVRDFIYRWQR